MLISGNSDGQPFNKIAELHKLQFKNYDILSSCSIKLITAFYEKISALNSTILITEVINDQAAGFIYVSIGETTPIRNFVKRNLFRILLNPIALAQVIKSVTNKLLDPSKFNYQNELVYLAVGNEYSGQGIATRLIKACEEELKKRKVNEYYLQVLADNSRAIRLYQYLNFKIVKRLNRLGTDKYIMKKEII